VPNLQSAGKGFGPVPKNIPVLKVLNPAILFWLLVKSTQPKVLKPVPPFAIGRIPVTSIEFRFIAAAVTVLVPSNLSGKLILKEGNLNAVIKDLVPPISWFNSFNKPLEIAVALGKLNVWTLPEEVIVKSVPEVLVAKV